jgi:ribosomal protein L2
MCYLPAKKTSTLKGIIKYANGGFSCINIPLGLKIGKVVKTVVSLNYKLGKMCNIALGDTVLLYLLKQRSIFFNVTSPEQNKNTLAKSAGTYCFIVAYERSKNYTKIQMPSGNQKYIYNFTFVTVGRNSNSARS